MSTTTNSTPAIDGLFSPGARPWRQLVDYTATAYRRLDEQPGEIGQIVRDLMQEWWRQLPTAARAQVAERFRSGEDAVHLGAFWELYLSRTLAGLDDEARVVPDIGNDGVSARRPDFRVTVGDSSFGVEACAVLGDDAVDRDVQKREGQFWNAVDRTRNRDFLLHVFLRFAGQQMPGKRLTRRIDRWLDTLDYEEVRQRSSSGVDLPATSIDFEGWRFDLRVSPKLPERRESAGSIGTRRTGNQTHRIEGNDRTFDFEGPKVMDDIRMLTNALCDKADHGYEHRDEPLIVAALCAGGWVDDDTVAQALFGRSVHRPSANGELVGEFSGGGLWTSPKGKPINTTISAVLVAMQLSPGSVNLIEPCLWINPWAAHRLDHASLPWRAMVVEDTIVERPMRRSSTDLLGLPPNWPRG